jgi:hypothetical protein
VSDSTQSEQKKRTLSDAVGQDEEYGSSYESEEEHEEVLTPEEAQRRTDELIAKMLADENNCDDLEYEIDKIDQAEEEKEQNRRAEQYTEMQVEQVKKHQIA